MTYMTDCALLTCNAAKLDSVSWAFIVEKFVLKFEWFKINSEARSRGTVCEQGLGDHA